MEKFRKLMIETRQKKGISRYKIAKETEIPYRTIQYIESGFTKTPTLANAVKIAKVLDIDLNKLKGV